MTYSGKDLPLDKFYQVVNDRTNKVIYGGWLRTEAQMVCIREGEPVTMYCDGTLSKTYDPVLGWDAHL